MQLYLSYTRLQTWASKSWSKAAVSHGWGGGQGLWWPEAGPAPAHAGGCPPDLGLHICNSTEHLEGKHHSFFVDLEPWS